MNKINLLECNEEELGSLLQSVGEPSYKGKQIYRWLQNGIKNFDDMTDLSLKLREKCKENFNIYSAEILDVKESKETGTKKYLLRYPDGNIIECVRMPYSHGYTACVSTQAGCNMGCAFCASTKHGMVRDLKYWEILEQLLVMNRDNREKITHVVIMGSGEPLLNYDNTVKFIKNINREKGLHISFRRVTLSTCGIVPKIYELADLDLPITLSISLHAPDDQIRNLLMPVNRKYPIKELMEAAKYYVKKTNRRLTYEYILIKGMNDSKEDALKLAKLLKNQLCHVNLIPVNPVEETNFKRPARGRIKEFTDTLTELGIQVTERREMGAGIDAACGQLRNRFLKE